MVTISIEDGGISFIRSSTVKSQTNALTRDSLKSLRAPTVDVGYVPNAKYLAHIPHQTQKIGF